MGKGKKVRLTVSTDVRALPPGFHRRRFAFGDVGCEVFIWRGTDRDGPVLLANGATHGDEYEGPTLLRQWAETWRPAAARLRGTVVLVPVLNEVAFYAGQRCRPDDGANLARSFPGRSDGGPTEQLAWLFDRELLAQCTHYVDFHSAGAANELLPWGGYIHGVTPAVDRLQRQMTACFDQFWCWAGPFLPGRTISAAARRRIPAIYTECRGAGDVADSDLAAMDAGLERLLILTGVLTGRMPRLRRQKLRITRSVEETHLQVHHLAPHDGIFVPAVKLGERLRRGQPIGEVLSLSGERTPVAAEESGQVVMRRLQRSVRQGDALAVLAPI